MRRTFAGILLVLMATLPIVAPRCEEQAPDKQLLTAQKTAVAPVMDGKLDDAVWREAREYSGFSLITGENQPSRYSTYIRCLYDDSNLYLSFRCVQDTALLKASTEFDGAVWYDDCVELFLTPHIATTLLQTRFPDEQHFHLIFNSLATKFDELGTGGAASWNGEWEVKTSVAPDEWRAEVKVPFSTLYHQKQCPPPFTSWSVQVGRSAQGEYATFFPTRGLYRLHSGFGYLVFTETPQEEPAIRWNLDRQNTFTPRLGNLRGSLREMAQTSHTQAYVQKIRAAQDAVTQLSQEFEKTPQAEYSRATQKEFQSKLLVTEKAVRKLQEEMVVKTTRQSGVSSGITLAPHPPVLDSQLVKPDFLPSPVDIGRAVEVTVTPGEYRAASVVLWTDRAQEDLTVKMGALISGKKSLPASTVDARWVKCWYQSGLNDIVREGNFLVPELLLKNPDLVQVDTAAQKNITRITPGLAERSYPADDEVLQPLKEMPARTAMQVWLTVHVPTGTGAGKYRTDIAVQSQGKTLARLPLELTVLDYQLAPSMLEHNWYARTFWGIPLASQNRKRAVAEARNMAQHGVDHPGLIENRKGLPEFLSVMKEGGLATDKIYLMNEGADLQFPPGMDPEAARAKAEAWVKEAGALGVKQVYLYLEDEARGEVLRSERPVAEAIRSTGAKTWVACYPDYFPLAGDFIDTPILSGGLIGQELVDKIHAAGQRVFSYGNPQGGVEKPEIYRRNYGLKLWQHNYDGAFDFIYYAAFGPHIAEWNPWDDFLSPYWRQHCMVYPTENGVVDTIQWEGWREGVNDCRYLATLLREIESARRAHRNLAAADTAEQWVEQLKTGGDGALADLDGVRAAITKHIAACRAVS